VAATEAIVIFFLTIAGREARSAVLLNAKGRAKNHEGLSMPEMAIPTARVLSSSLTRNSQPVSQTGVHPE